jgi:hypothetical protein
MVGQVTVTPEAMARLRSDEVLVFDWVHIAICCAGAGEVSLHSVPAQRVAGSSAYVSMRSDPPSRVYAHRTAYPHLAGRHTLVGVRGRRLRRFTADLPDDFGLRSIFGRADDASDRAFPLRSGKGNSRCRP